MNYKKKSIRDVSFAGKKVLLRVEGVSAPLAGTAEIRNLKFAVETQPVFPAYRTLTALASRSNSS